MKMLARLGATGVLTLLLAFTAEAHNGHHHGKKNKRTKVVVVNSPSTCSSHKTIRVLPRNHRVIVHQGVKYYRCNNIYYVKKRGSYIVVKPPRAVLVIR